MADVTADLKSKLDSASAVHSLVGDRVYGGVVPAGSALPFVWLQRKDSRGLEVLDDDAGGPYREAFEAECWAEDGAVAVSVGEAVRAALDGIRGTVGANPYIGISVGTASDSYAQRNVDAGEFLFVTTLEIEVLIP